MQTSLASHDPHKSASAHTGSSSVSPVEDIEEFSFAQQLFKLQVVSQSSLRQKNVVWISKEDFSSLFGETANRKTPHYIQIADQVHRVMVAKIQEGWMAVSNTQIDSWNDALLTPTSQNTVAAIPFEPSDSNTFSLQKAELFLSEENILAGDEKIVIHADDLRQAIAERLQGEFITKKKTVSLGFPWGELRGEIFSTSPANQYKTHQISYGMLDEETEIKILGGLANQVVVVKDVLQEEVSRFNFKLTTSKRLSTAKRDALPLVVSYEEIRNALESKLTGNVICKGQSIKIPHPSGWDIVVKLNSTFLDPAYLAKQNGALDEEELETGYVLTHSSDIKLNANPGDILVTKGPPVEAEELTVKVFDIPGTASHPTINQETERWIHAEELKDLLIERAEPYALNQRMEVSLSSGTYLLEVSRAKSDSTLERNEYTESWKIGPETHVEIEAVEELSLNLVQDLNPIPMKKATFKINADKIPDEGINISVAELRQMIAAQGPERLVHNQSFAVRTEFSDTLALTLMDLEFEGSRDFEQGMTAFGTISETTDLDFMVVAKHKIDVIDTVYKDEVEKLKFTLSATKRSGTGKVARLPLVIDYDEVTAKIQKELSQYKYILEGLVITIPCGDGWDIQAKFQKGILNRLAGSGSDHHRFSSITSKKGFETTGETSIEFVPHMHGIVLVKGSPEEATSLSVKVVKMLENHNSDEDLIQKGNWINLEEVKAALMDSDKPFAKSEKIVLDLSSGKFLLEVRTARSNALKGLSPREIKSLRWTVGSGTQISLAIDKSLDLQKVNNAEMYPLKKIEFNVVPVGRASEHISLKDEEIRQALQAAMPLQIIKGNVLAVDTEGNHTLNLEVKKMTLHKDSKKLDPSRVFGLITEETEIVFRGKEDTNLAIRSSPKILEMKDPLKYLEEKGIGGIDEQFKQIYRIFFARSDRLGEEAARRGTKPIKGILLYGPPGTGKTTLARHIGDMLGCSGERIIMHTATEIFNMWFGKSEENIRKMFKPARDAQDKYGDESPLYIVVIDEIDALLPKRGGSVNKVRDSLVNQFLGEMDGLNEIKNLLVVGITNRKEEIDPAALRHGRFGVHVEIGLPDSAGRKKIFQIHTRELAEEGLLDASVDLDSLAARTPNFTGAEIEGLVEEASLYSLERLNKLECSKEELKTHTDGLVTMQDFEQALREYKKDDKEIPEGVKRLYL